MAWKKCPAIFFFYFLFEVLSYNFFSASPSALLALTLGHWPEQVVVMQRWRPDKVTASSLPFCSLLPSMFFGFLFLFVFFFAEMGARQSHSKKFASILYVSFFVCFSFFCSDGGWAQHSNLFVISFLLPLMFFSFLFLQQWRMNKAAKSSLPFSFCFLIVTFLFVNISDWHWLLVTDRKIGRDKATKGTLPLSLTSWASDRKVLAQKRVFFFLKIPLPMIFK